MFRFCLGGGEWIASKGLGGGERTDLSNGAKLLDLMLVLVGIWVGFGFGFEFEFGFGFGSGCKGHVGFGFDWGILWMRKSKLCPGI